MTARKTITTAIRDFAEQRAYFSIGDLREYLRQSKIVFAENSVKMTVARLKRENVIFSAGRGFYSILKDMVSLETEKLEPLKQLLVEKYPFLPFTIWSTSQIAFAYHHIPVVHPTLICSEKDALSGVKDYLNSKGFLAFDNPSKQEIEKYFQVESNTIVLRPSVTRQKDQDYFATIEAILVDLYIESQKLFLMDMAEFQRILKYFITHYRLNLSYFFDYADRRKIKQEMMQLVKMYTNATLA
ncbi:MAG: DUF6577 family protein [archaeon]